MEAPCKDCKIRKDFARKFDIHIWGDDCFYVCEKYEHWKNEQVKKERGQDDDWLETLPVLRR